MILQTTGPNGLLYKTIERALKEAHCTDKVKLGVVNTKNIKSEYREAIKKQYDISQIEDNDIMICFEELPEAQNPIPPTNQQPTQAQPQTPPPTNQETEVPDNPEQEAKDNQEETERVVKEMLELDEAEPAPMKKDNEQAPQQEQQPQNPPPEKTQAPSSTQAPQKEQAPAAQPQPQQQPQQQPQPSQAPQNNDGSQEEPGDGSDEIEDASSQEDKQVEDQGQTVDTSKNRQVVLDSVCRALFIENKKDVESFDVNMNGISTFFIVLKIRK